MKQVLPKVYIASSWRMKDFCLDLARMLRADGVKVYCFCDPENFAFWWPDVANENDDAITALRYPESREGFEVDKKGLDWANTCVLCVPSGKDSHLEAGYIKGKGGRLIIFGQYEKGEFSNMYHMADALFYSSQYKELLDDIWQD